jgi:hypothetical protein
VQGEGLVGKQNIEPSGAGAVADWPARRDQRRRGGDLRVRDAEQDDVRARTVGTAGERTVDLDAGTSERVREGCAETPPANDCQAPTRGGIRGGIPFQFSHVRYRSAESDGGWSSRSIP